MVLDRLFFWLFSTSCIVGTCGIILQAPMIYDQRQPLGNGGVDIKWCGLMECESLLGGLAESLEESLRDIGLIAGDAIFTGDELPEGMTIP
jgi:hypothetical protein